MWGHGAGNKHRGRGRQAAGSRHWVSWWHAGNVDYWLTDYWLPLTPLTADGWWWHCWQPWTLTLTSKEAGFSLNHATMNDPWWTAQVFIESLTKLDIVMVCGSICKDWSSMGKREGFSGQWVILTAIMFTLARKILPWIFFHECTSRFPFQIFETVLGTTHTGFHCAMSPVDYGAPVKRARSYDAVVTWIGIGVGFDVESKIKYCDSWLVIVTVTGLCK